jgi:hypothetical protein
MSVSVYFVSEGQNTQLSAVTVGQVETEGIYIYMVKGEGKAIPVTGHEGP